MIGRLINLLSFEKVMIFLIVCCVFLNVYFININLNLIFFRFVVLGFILRVKLVNVEIFFLIVIFFDVGG